MDARHEVLGKISQARRKLREASFQIAVLEQQRSEAALELHSAYEALCQLEVEPFVLLVDQPKPGVGA